MLLIPGSPAVSITIKRSARARRFSLRISQTTGQVSLTLPLRAREAEALAFARAQEGWIRAALARLRGASADPDRGCGAVGAPRG